MTKYYYLDVSLEFASEFENEITPSFFKLNIVKALETLFGQVASAVDIDLLKYCPRSKRAIIRVPASSYVKLRASLTLCGEYQLVPCAYRIHKATPLLLALQGDSRDFEH